MQQSDVENAAEVCRLLFELTQDEGDSVEICNPNPDFGSGPAATICVIREFGSTMHYVGESILECLQKAKADETGGMS